MKTLQPNSRSCFVCGMKNPFGLKLRFFETEPGGVAVDLVLSEEYQGYPGVAHGGIVAAILDEAAGRAHMSGFVPEIPPRFMFTARLDVRYRKNVPVGKPLRLIGKVTSSKKRTATAKSAVYDQQGNLLAEAEVLLVNVPDGTLQAVDLEALGWKVYPEEK